MGRRRISDKQRLEVLAEHDAGASVRIPELLTPLFRSTCRLPLSRYR